MGWRITYLIFIYYSIKLIEMKFHFRSAPQMGHRSARMIFVTIYEHCEHF